MNLCPTCAEYVQQTPTRVCTGTGRRRPAGHSLTHTGPWRDTHTVTDTGTHTHTALHFIVGGGAVALLPNKGEGGRGGNPFLSCDVTA